MMNTYISAAGSEHARAAKLEEAIWEARRVRGGAPVINLNDRWWVDPSFVGKDHQHSPEERRRITRAHFANIEDAECFWFLAPSQGHHSRGAWAELGYAQAQSRALTIVVSGERATDSVFTSLSDRLFMSDQEALAYIVDLAVRS